MDIRKVLIAQLKSGKKSRYWLATQAEARKIANRETVFRFLRGKRDTSATVIAGLLVLAGVKLDRTGEFAKDRDIPRRKTTRKKAA